MQNTLTQIIKNTNIMNTINIISHNWCINDCNFLNNNWSETTNPTKEQVDRFYPEYGPEQGYPEYPEDFSITTVQKDRICLWLTESFGRLISQTITCTGDDDCIDYTPSAIEQFFSVLKLLKDSNDQEIQEQLSRCNFDLWARVFDTRIASFDHKDESAPGFISYFLDWDESLASQAFFSYFI